jgi:hypothetical protein
MLIREEGFKLLNQAQLLNDIVWYPSSSEEQQWLIYFISRPLLGTCVSTTIPALQAAISPGVTRPSSVTRLAKSEPSGASSPRKKEVNSFSDLLNNFPMIARQMQPGLERLFKEFTASFQKPSHPKPVTTNGDMIQPVQSVDVAKHATSNGYITALPYSDAEPENEDEEMALRKGLETAVTAAIDLFQLIDKQQLSLLGATTDLTGPTVERLIERYITEQLHDSILFPRVCSSRKIEDSELEWKIRQMEYLDISQVGKWGETFFSLDDECRHVGLASIGRRGQISDSTPPSSTCLYATVYFYRRR